MDAWDAVANDGVVKAGIYLRVSTLDQKDGHGIELQKTKCEAMALVKGWVVTQIYKDEGISGTIKETERSGFSQLIRDAKSKKIGAVIVYAMDRLGRRTQIVLRTIENLSEMGINVVSCRENLDTSTPAGTFMVTIFAALTQLERDTIVERMRAGTEERRKIDGDIGGHMPMGYKRARGTVLIDEEKSEVVRYIFERRFLYFRFYDEIAIELNDRGAPVATKRSKEWTPSAVRKILDNEAKYLGGYRNKSKFRWPRILPLDFKEREKESLRRKNESRKLDLPEPEGARKNRRTQNFKNDRNIRRSKKALEQLKAMQKGEVLPRHTKIEVKTPKIIEDDTVINVVPKTPSPIRKSALKISIPSPVRKSSAPPPEVRVSPKIQIPSPPRRKRKMRIPKTTVEESVVESAVEPVPEPSLPIGLGGSSSSLRARISTTPLKIQIPSPVRGKPQQTSKISIPSPEFSRRR